ncbi:DUF2019 domain-containing protein [Aurantimonas sp. A2-1-M11]|uniref:DUF2019 domain-containing protein n=1 Tax=Aurantimonas sp. A2-1-M11 TaxID=3113712 RepID=UPI002F95F33E
MGRRGGSDEIAAIVAAWREAGLAQDRAIAADDAGAFNRLARRLLAYETTLNDRAGDGRRALLPLLADGNVQVRLNAAHATLTIAPEAARQALAAIARDEAGTQAMDVGMTLRMLDDGRFVPR